MKNLSTAEIREAFLKYFEKNGHTIAPSSSLVPGNDPTLLFTNAGMVQFKDVFLGKETKPYTRATTCQRCLRAGGKHNDLENVGYTTRHHTFFEMLGNFSFGDYFKKDAIHYAWDFLTNVLEVPSDRLVVTVHEKDSEAENLWNEEFKKSGKQPQCAIIKCGDKDNFWSMGEVGPCGYCSEIFYDHGEKLPGGKPGAPDEGGERYVEIWNLVFMQFERDKSGKLTPLPKPSVDTGMGLERIAAALRGVYDNYDIDVFVDLIQKIKTLGHLAKCVDKSELKTALRIVADHIRAITSLIADGVLPSNEGRGYVLRSILRRAVYHLYIVGVREPLLAKIIEQPEIKKVVMREEEQFLETLERGVKILDDEITKLKTKIIPGNIVFLLHDTYGFPAILTAEIARKKGLTIDQVGFDALMEKQREASRAASKFGAIEEVKIDIGGETKFVGYDKVSCPAKIRYVSKHGDEEIIILDQTSFYAESGGQVGDTGELISKTAVFVVSDTKKHGALILHYGCTTQGVLAVGDEVDAKVDGERRQAIKINHSAAHLLHRSLHMVLGEHALQRGSMVDQKRLRFDFTHFAALTAEELHKIERMVNSKIRADLEVHTKVMSINEAKKAGAVALFGEKYGDEVRVVTMGDFSKELCGGTHVVRTGELGVFKIVAEIGIASGVRRIEAVTGENALNLFDAKEAESNKESQQLREIIKTNEKEIVRLKNMLAANKANDLVSQAVVVGTVKVLAVKLENVDSKALRQSLDALKQQLGSAVILLATINDNKIQLVAGITKDLTSSYSANDLLQYIVKQINGSGGGRADMAQGGGTDVAALDNAINSVFDWVKNK